MEEIVDPCGLHTALGPLLEGPDDFVEESGLPCDFAEVTIHYGEEEKSDPNDITKSMLKLRYNTPVKLLEEQAKVSVSEVRCSGYIEESRINSLDETDVVFDFTNKREAHRFHNELEAMKLELFAWRLQFPQPDERIALHLQTAEVLCEDVFISDAEVFIVKGLTGKFRLIIVSRNKCTIISQVLVDDFFSNPGAPANFSSPAHLVQLGGRGERKIYYYQRGFKFLKFNTRESERMFELGRNALSSTLPLRPITSS